VHFQVYTFFLKSLKYCENRVKWNAFTRIESLLNDIRYNLFIALIIGLISSPMKSCLFSCRISEKTIFISVDRKTIICGFNGYMDMAIVEEKNFSSPDKI
jgi:hypothetical protein